MTIVLVIGSIFLGVTTLVVALGFLFPDNQEKKELVDRLDTFTFYRSAEAEVTELLR